MQWALNVGAAWIGFYEDLSVSGNVAATKKLEDRKQCEPRKKARDESLTRFERSWRGVGDSFADSGRKGETLIRLPGDKLDR